MATRLAGATHALFATLAETVTPPPPVDYLTWAKDNIVFSREASPDFAGSYNERLFPFWSEILNALGEDDPCRLVTVQGSAQVGKTVLGNVFTLGSVAMDPGLFMYAHPTTDNAIRWSRTKLVPMLRETTALAGLFPERSRDSANSTLYKERADGRGAILITGANSPASLSMITVPRQVQDDLSKWDADNGAGDPESQADSRSKAVYRAKILKLSTPTILPGCRITANFESGSQETYCVPCPHCEHLQPLEWENMREHLDPDKPERAAFFCVACGGEIREHHRAQIVLPEHLGGRAKWVARYPERKRHHRSFRIWAAYGPLESWENIARAWLRVKDTGVEGADNDNGRGRAAEQVFLNDYAGIALEIGDAVVDWQTLRDRAEVPDATRRGIVPPGAVFLTLGIDVQADRVEWQLVGWGRHQWRFVIDRGVIDGANSEPGKTNTGFVTEPAMMAAMDRLASRSWPDVLGNRRGIDRIAIDGNAWTEDVWEWARRHPAGKVMMVRGTDRGHLLIKVKRQHNHRGKKLRYAARFFNFNASALKTRLYSFLKKDDPAAPGFVAFASGLGDDYFEQLTAERWTPVKSGGRTIYRWENIRPRNEMLDTMNQAEAAALPLGVRFMSDEDWDRHEAARCSPPPPAQMDFEHMTTAPPANAAPVKTASLAEQIAVARARAQAARRG